MSAILVVEAPANTGSDLGYRMLVVIDACGGMTARTEQAALQRMQAAGVNLVSVMTLLQPRCSNSGRCTLELDRSHQDEVAVIEAAR